MQWPHYLAVIGIVVIIVVIIIDMMNYTEDEPEECPWEPDHPQETWSDDSGTDTY